MLVLGSAPLPVQRRLAESRVPHWSFGEMRDAFGWDLDAYLVYGGIRDPSHW